MDIPFRRPVSSRTRLRLLLVGVREDDALFIVDEVQSGGYEVTWERVSATALAEALQRQAWDLIACDSEAPEFDAATVFEVLRGRRGKAVVIVASGRGREESAGAPMRPGAHEFVSTHTLAHLGPAIHREMLHAELRRKCEQAEEALREAELRLDLTVTGSNAGLWDWDLRTNTSHYSRRWRELLGYGEDEIGGGMEDWFKLVHPDDRERLATYALEYLRNPSTRYELEFRIRHKDGSERCILSRATGILDPDGRPIRLVGLHVDITDRKRAEEAQRQAAEVTAALARVGQEMVSSLDPPVLLNKLCRLTTEVLGCDVSYTLLWEREEDVLAPVAGYGDTQEQWESIRALLIPRAALAESVARIEREGFAQWVSGQPRDPAAVALATSYGITASLSVALRRGGEMSGLLVAGYRGRCEPFGSQQERIACGVAQLASMALENARLVAELRRADRLKSEFVATMSHELRTPLNAIIGYNDLLAEGEFGPLTAKQADVMQRVQQSSLQLLDLINTTLDLSRLEKGELPLDVRDVALPELLSQVDADTRALGEKPGVPLLWDVAPHLPRLRTDPGKLMLVLKNLIANALKFTERGTVTVAVRGCDDGVEIAVADTGVGIAPKNHAMIFEPFRQIEPCMTRRYGGVGLGLYIVRRMLDALGGTITLDSELGRGSTFRVRLPAGAESGEVGGYRTARRAREGRGSL
jgi:PAS domain S-box-containing protein